MEGIDILYQVAAAYKMWAKDPQKDIIDMNIQGTENVLETAKKQSVKKIVYVSLWQNGCNSFKMPINT